MFSLWLNALERVQAPDVRFESRLCSRTKFSKSSCRRCLEACPTSAISLNPPVTIDAAKCTSCGKCISLCPNGAFWTERYSDSHLIREMRLLLERSFQKVISIGCQQTAGDPNNTVGLPCLGWLSEALLLAPFALGATGVDILLPDCQDCKKKGGANSLDRVVSLTRRLLAFTGSMGNQISIVEVGNPAHRPKRPGRLFSRRGLFGAARGELRNVATALLPEEGLSETTGPTPRPVNRNRATLLALMKSFGERPAMLIDPDGFPLAEVEIGQSCAGCNVCETVCPTGALRRTTSRDGISLFFKPHLCTACGNCQQACLLGAISFKHCYDLSWLTLESEIEVAQLERMRCLECHKEYWGMQGQASCPSCRLQQKATVSPRTL